MKESGEIRGLIFDFDGTIVDTELPAYQAWQEIFEEHGCSLPLLEWAQSLGGGDRGFDPCLHLEMQLGRALDQTALRERRQARKIELLAAEVLLPGVVEYVEAARRLDLRLAVASSSPRDWVVEHLDRFGLLDFFHSVSCADDVARVKPDPALFERALNLLDLQPEEAIVIEDSPNGITAAKAAGIYCVVVPNALTRELSIGHADRRLECLLDLPLESLIAIVARERQGGRTHGADLIR
ncbi:MAG: HAD family hydrolase [Dehalococcoidia bacterium]